jgi:glycosyltransferase involved in cell wall biosynthesis
MISPPILFLVDSMNVGGIERQVIELLKGLRRSGRYRPLLTILNRGGTWDTRALQVAEGDMGVSREFYLDLGFPFRLYHRAKEEGTRLIHTYGWMSAVTGFLVARQLGVPVVNASAQNASPFLWHHHIGGWFARWSDAAIANSRVGLQGYGLEEHPRGLVIRNGVDLERFRDVTPVDYPGPTICMVANFSRNKDHATLIRALPEIRREYPEAGLVLIGRDAGTLEENRALNRRLGYVEYVRFLTDVTRPEPYIAGSTLCVLTSSAKGEGIANALLEYMALGKPVIATDCGGNREVITPGENGFLVPGGMPIPLAERAIHILGSPGLARQMGQSGRELVQRAFSLERLVAQHETLYATLLSSK